MIASQVKLPDLDDTIVAQSSAAGPAAHAIVRLSGRRALPIVSALCPDFVAPPPARFVRANLHLPGFDASIPADIYHFVAPRTFTVNGTSFDCVKGGTFTLPAPQNGGFCMQASAGDYAYAYFGTF